MSTTTTDFEEWVGAVDPQDFEEIYALYNAVRDEEDAMGYKCSRKGDQLFITYEEYKGPNETTNVILRLASKESKEYFLKWYEKKFCIDMDMESWYGMQKAINNPHA